MAMHHDLNRVIKDADNDPELYQIWRDSYSFMTQQRHAIQQELRRRNVDWTVDGPVTMTNH